MSSGRTVLLSMHCVAATPTDHCGAATLNRAQHEGADSNEVELLRAGKVEQWSSLFQVLLTTAHHQLDALYSGLQDSQEAMAYR